MLKRATFSKDIISIYVSSGGYFVILITVPNQSLHFGVVVAALSMLVERILIVIDKYIQSHDC